MTLYLYSKKQWLYRMQIKYILHKELIQWTTAAIVALIIAGIVILIVRAVVPL